MEFVITVIGVVFTIATFFFVVIAYLLQRLRQKNYKFTIDKVDSRVGYDGMHLSCGVFISNKTENEITVKDASAQLIRSSDNFVAPMRLCNYRLSMDMKINDRKMLILSFEHCNRGNMNISYDKFTLTIFSSHSTSDSLSGDIKS